MNSKQFIDLVKATFSKWQQHDATLRAGALTFYTILPLPSLALIAVAILAQIYGQTEAFNQFISQVTILAGPTVANLLSELLISARSPLTSFFDSLIAIAFTISGALGAFSVLQKSMNIIWEIKPSKKGLLGTLKEKSLPFLLILIIGLILVISTAFSSLLFSASVSILKPLIGNFSSLLLQILYIFLTLGLGTLLFGIIFKLLPETDVKWRDVWLAALITAFVFTVLNYVFDLYVSLFHVSTLAGTAGVLLVLFTWVYIAFLFILFGAQLSKEFAETFGSHLNRHKPVEKQPNDEIDKLEVQTKLEIKVKPDNKN
jgi:membrane protein